MKPIRNKTPKHPLPSSQNFRSVNICSEDIQEGIDSTSSVDDVCVFCRLRPTEFDSCIDILDSTTLRLCPPAGSRAFESGREFQFVFKHVFGHNSSQKEVFDKVAFPLVSDALHGKNGLLFSYGVTGSGKTYSMQGSIDDGGFVPRTIDVLFNSIEMENMIPQKYRIKPDATNGFVVQSLTEALADERIRSNQKRYRMFSTDIDCLSSRIVDDTKCHGLPSDVVYAIFISFYEIYNNYIYDLLDYQEDVASFKPKFLSRPIKEDKDRQPYVSGAVELEVRSANEALELYFRGQKRRRVAETSLNQESSRSHSIFRIRVVQISKNIEVGRQDISVCQLSLVDLAGSERTVRTKNTGDKLKEGSNINQSLMTLRQCIETLRENQKTGSSKHVAYRESKLTRLFSGFFEGIGKVRMLVCVNPQLDDYDENFNVMKFAELTQEVKITFKSPLPPPPVTPRQRQVETPGRRKGNDFFREALKQRIVNETPVEIRRKSDLVYFLPSLPLCDVKNENETSNEKMKNFLTQRIFSRNVFLKDHEELVAKFRQTLVRMQQNETLLFDENARLKRQLSDCQRKNNELNSRLVLTETTNQSLQRRVGAHCDTKNKLEKELDDKERAFIEERNSRKRVLKRLERTVENKDANIEELQEKLLKKTESNERNLKMSSKIEAIKRMIDSENEDEVSSTAKDIEVAPLSPIKVNSENCNIQDGFSTPQATNTYSVGVSNPRFRRSRSVDAKLWLNHQSTMPVPTGTILQPNFSNKPRTVKYIEKNDIVNKKVGLYCLTDQNQLPNGELETKIFKGDVIPTTGGGRQVILDDVEILRQTSPVKLEKTNYRRRSKRSFEELECLQSRIDSLQKHAETPNKFSRAKISRKERH